ncbi:hypothetical protein ACOMHN_023888 [Nucella lapillus]
MAASGFREEEFVEVCEELEKPQLAGWELFVECHGYIVYRLYDKASGLYQYKTYGVLEDVPPEVCADVFMDYRYRQHWDAYVKSNHYVFRNALRRVRHKGREVWVTLVRSVPCCLPERPGIVRVDSFAQTCVLTSDGKSGTKSFMYYFDNPKGNIPTWMVNWAAKKGIPEFILTVQEACRGYKTWQQQQQQRRRQSQQQQ